MGEVIWALNPANDSLEDLISYIHYYIKSFIEHNNLVGEFKFEGISTHNIPLSAQQRRNTFLVIKEFLHNTLKHAAADKIGIYVHVSDNFLQIEIYDNGIGLNYEVQHSSGNGLLNIKKRITQSGGTYRFSENQPTGFKLNFRLPLTIYYENK
jgi:signal transduction histidine kinase